MTDVTEDAIRDGQTVARFLEDPVILGALERLDQDAIRAWKVATTPAEREAAWYQAKAVEAFTARMRGLIGQGQQAERRLRS
jgi:hypothetical protein